MHQDAPSAGGWERGVPPEWSFALFEATLGVVVSGWSLKRFSKVGDGWEKPITQVGMG